MVIGNYAAASVCASFGLVVGASCRCWVHVRPGKYASVVRFDAGVRAALRIAWQQAVEGVGSLSKEGGVDAMRGLE